MFNDVNKVKIEIQRFLYSKSNKKNVLIDWKKEPLFPKKVQINWVEQYLSFDNCWILNSRIYNENDSIVYRKSSDIMKDSIKYLFIYFNNKMILNLNFNDDINTLKDISIVNNVIQGQNGQKISENPTITITKKDGDTTYIEEFSIKNGGDLLDFKSRLNKD